MLPRYSKPLGSKGANDTIIFYVDLCKELQDPQLRSGLVEVFWRMFIFSLGSKKGNQVGTVGFALTYITIACNKNFPLTAFWNMIKFGREFFARRSTNFFQKTYFSSRAPIAKKTHLFLPTAYVFGMQHFFCKPLKWLLKVKIKPSLRWASPGHRPSC